MGKFLSRRSAIRVPRGSCARLSSTGLCSTSGFHGATSTNRWRPSTEQIQKREKKSARRARPALAPPYHSSRPGAAPARTAAPPRPAPNINAKSLFREDPLTCWLSHENRLRSPAPMRWSTCGRRAAAAPSRSSAPLHGSARRLSEAAGNPGHPGLSVQKIASSMSPSVTPTQQTAPRRVVGASGPAGHSPHRSIPFPARSARARAAPTLSRDGARKNENPGTMIK